MSLDRSLVRSILRREKETHGGKIVGNKLYPIGPYLTALLPTYPAADLIRAWYVVQTEAHREATVEDELQDIGFDCYCPKQSVRQARHSLFGRTRHVVVARPLLPGYVFAGFDVARETWQGVNSMRGVHRILMFDLRPVPIAPAVIDYIRMREVQLMVSPKKLPQPINMKVGVVVRIIEPLAFAGLFGFVRSVGKASVCVEIDLFGRLVPLHIEPDKLEVA